MLAATRATLETYCQDTGRPLDVVKRWFRKLPSDDARDRVIRNLEVAHARRETGIVGDRPIVATGLTL